LEPNPNNDSRARMTNLIESRQIRAFMAVARRGSFTHGAKDVFLTQSAVSHAIKSMEADLSCHLFRRVGKHAVLTEAGDRLLQHCEEILQKMRDARADLSQLPGSGQVALRIGAPTTVCQHIVPGVLRSLQEQFPQSGLRIETGDNPQLLAQLLAGRVDLAIMVEPERRPDLAFEPVFSDELHFLMPRSHAWVGLPEISAAHIEQTTLIVPNKTTRTHQLITGYLRARRIIMEKYIEPGSIESIKELVKNGLGVGVVAQWPIRAELQSGELVTRPLGKIPLARQWHAVHLRSRPLNETEGAFVRLFRLAAAKLVQPGSAAVPSRVPVFKGTGSAVVV
jgi:DNA-binding transcriptional LysR family regulator